MIEDEGSNDLEEKITLCSWKSPSREIITEETMKHLSENPSSRGYAKCVPCDGFDKRCPDYTVFNSEV